MPALAWWLIAGGLGALGVGGGLRLAGDAVDDTGSGALKLAGAAAVGVGLWIAWKRLA